MPVLVSSDCSHTSCPGRSRAAQIHSSVACEEWMLYRLQVQHEDSGRSGLVRTCFLFHTQSVCFALTLGKR